MRRVPQTAICRFYSLDVLRGIAALSVVLFHWQHFFFVGPRLGPFAPDRLPLHGVLFWVYDKGWLAVDLFFLISGFIFYWLYSRGIAEGKTRGARFALLRFSRLWPLQFATLLIVAALQAAFFSRQGAYFVYPNNGPIEFAMHLFGLNVWTRDAFSSFNGPAWSISAEVFLYALFVAACLLLPVKARELGLVVIVGHALHLTPLPALRGVETFFLGGLLFLAYQAIVSRGELRLWRDRVVVLALIAWCIGIAVMLFDVQLPFVWRLKSWLVDVYEDWVRLVIFPSTILALALIETSRGHLGKRIAVLGDISYSSYLLHFPLQLIAASLAIAAGGDATTFYAGWTMAVFFAVLIGISLLSFRYFEMPAQSMIRAWPARRLVPVAA